MKSRFENFQKIPRKKPFTQSILSATAGKLMKLYFVADVFLKTLRKFLEQLFLRTPLKTALAFST